MQVITIALFVILWLAPRPTSNGPGPPSEGPVATSDMVTTGDGGRGPKDLWKDDVAPIFAARCQPCHFSGGVMHAKLPFDDPTTIRKLGTEVFTRIRDDKERAAINAFLAQ